MTTSTTHYATAAARADREAALTTVEMAYVMGCSTSQVRAELAQAIEHFKAEMLDRGIEVSDLLLDPHELQR